MPTRTAVLALLTSVVILILSILVLLDKSQSQPKFVQAQAATVTFSPSPSPTTVLSPQPQSTVNYPPPQTATVIPSPTNNGGKATWTVRSRVFLSRYPDGFIFVLDAFSSVGKIESASVSWSPAPGHVMRTRAVITSDGRLAAVGGNGIVSPRIPAWMPINYWWTLTDEEGNTFETPHLYEEYADTTRKWSRLESDDALVIWQEGVPNEIGQSVVEAMAKMRPVWAQHWGRLLDFKPHIVIFATREDFASWNPELGNTTVGDVYYAGQSTIDWGGTVLFYQRKYDVIINVYSLVLHEVSHLYQGRSGALSTGGWFIEGNAAYFEQIYAKNTSVRFCVWEAQQMAAAGKLPSLSNAPSTSYSREGYIEGCAFFHWLTEKYGPDAHRKLWELLSRNIARTEALEQVTGLKFREMDVAFRKWIGVVDPVAATEVVLPTMQFPPTRPPRATATPR